VTYDKNTPIAGKGSGDPIKIVDWAIKNGAVGHADLKQYVNPVYTLAPGKPPPSLIWSTCTFTTRAKTSRTSLMQRWTLGGIMR
jgi:hypothetical protein